MVREFNPDQRRVAIDYKKWLGLDGLTEDELVTAIEQLGLPSDDRDGIIDEQTADTDIDDTPSDEEIIRDTLKHTGGRALRAAGVRKKRPGQLSMNPEAIRSRNQRAKRRASTEEAQLRNRDAWKR